VDSYAVTGPPAVEPVTLDEAKKSAKIRSTADDAFITGLIATSRQRVEDFTNRLLITQTVEGYFDCLELSKYETYPFVYFRRAPLGSITAVEVDEGDGYVAILDFQVKQQSDGYPIILFTGSPTLDRTAQAYPLKITAVIGYGLATAVPELIKTSIKMDVNFLYENRGDAMPDGDPELPEEIKRLLRPGFKIVHTFG
jgi:uncharacterized phiE125 gp8 family phage protein